MRYHNTGIDNANLSDLKKKKPSDVSTAGQGKVLITAKSSESIINRTLYSTGLWGEAFEVN